MISSFVLFLNSLPSEITLFLLFLLSSILLITFARFFGKLGLYTYSVLAILLGNIQVLKGTQLYFWSEPVALGTILFSSTFIASDVLTECFGKKAAQRSVGLGFISALMVTVLMTVTLGVTPVSLSEGSASFIAGHQAMEVLFKPSTAIFSASLLAYIMSQLLDISLFQKLKEIWPHKAFWMRSIISTAVAFLLDNIIFSTLAWVIFAETPVSFKTLIWTYILGTYTLRLMMSFLSLPVTYIARKIVKASYDSV